MLIAIWTIALLGISLWTLAAWGLAQVLTLDPTRLQGLKPLIHEIPFGETIDQWFPPWRGLLAVAVDMTEHLVRWVGDAAPWLVWAVWGTGTGLMLLLAGLTSLAVVLIQRGVRVSERQRALDAPPHSSDPLARSI